MALHRTVISAASLVCCFLSACTSQAPACIMHHDVNESEYIEFLQPLRESFLKLCLCLRIGLECRRLLVGDDVAE